MPGRQCFVAGFAVTLDHRMIDCGIFPGEGCVAVITGTGGGYVIIRLAGCYPAIMTALTGVRRSLEHATQVAVITFHTGMRATQRKPCRKMIKPSLVYINRSGRTGQTGQQHCKQY